MSELLLSYNEAIAILEEVNCPFGKLQTNRDILYWCVEHESELPYSPVKIMKAFFPHNPQNIRDNLV